MYQYLIHLLHLFCIKLFSPQEIILTIIMTRFHTYLMLSFIFALFDLYEKLVNQVMSIRILITNFHVLRFDIYDIPTYEH